MNLGLTLILSRMPLSRKGVFFLVSASASTPWSDQVDSGSCSSLTESQMREACRNCGCGAYYCALSPRGRGLKTSSSKRKWGEGVASSYAFGSCEEAPHPTVFVERQVLPSPARGEGTTMSAARALAALSSLFVTL